MSRLWRGTGHLLLWAGFLTGTFAAVMRLENPQHPRWHTVPWGLYALGLLAGALGVVLLRVARWRTGRDRHAADEKQVRLIDLSQQLHQHATELSANIDEQNIATLPQQLDTILAPLLAEFAESRTTIIHRHGLTAFGRVMSAFAAGERSVNRAWCASVDGYLDEARQCLEAAVRAFDDLRKQLEQLHS
ncbi:MAG: hypothetical protein KatS3mg110_2774 [Pirellulaceae bacterium]|nr:MAG: hypothetical protein KatS3mg110_2774 [Pirellulaceae bacterium]